MALLKSYSCVKCGGVLNFDEDQEVFGCPFCGGEYAFTDFHRGDLIKQGKMSLLRGNYSTAKDKFQAILKRNPRDFEALQGLILAEGQIPAVNRLCRIDYLENAKLQEAVQAAKNAQEALKEEADYFGLLTRMLELAYEYHKNSDEADEVTKAQNKRFRDMSYELMGIEEEEEVAIDNYLKLIRYIALRGLIIVLAASAVMEIWWVTAIYVGFFALIGAIIKLYYFTKKKKVDRRLSSEMKQQYVKDDGVAVNLQDIRHDYMNTYIKLKRIVPDPKAYEKPLPTAKSDAPAADDPFISIEKNVICNKCGGQLTLDKEKKLYECRSCGVAYGASLFFGDPFEKASEALKANDFTEADQRFSHILMMDPHAFDALLGRILCAGRWRSINDIALTDHVIPASRMSELSERTAEAVAHVSEENRSLMEDIRKLIELYCEYMRQLQVSNTYNDRLEYISKNRQTLLAHKNDKYSPLKDEPEYVQKRREANAAKHNAKVEFEELKPKILRGNANRLSKG